MIRQLNEDKNIDGIKVFRADSNRSLLIEFRLNGIVHTFGLAEHLLQLTTKKEQKTPEWMKNLPPEIQRIYTAILDYIS